MIQEVDETLRTLIRREALNGSEVDVAFDAPTRDWAARRNAPTLDLYLYDIREDVQRREVMWESVRNEVGRVTERRPPPRHYKLSYLVTAWTQRPEDEHRLLSAVLSCFMRYPTLPENALSGSLAQAGLPLWTTIALPPPPDRSLSDVWSALGGELKPSLDLVIVAPLEERRQEQAGPPVREMPRIRVTRPDSEAKRSGGGGRRRAAPAGTAEGRESDSPDESAATPEGDEAGGVDEEAEPAAEGELRLEDTRHSGTEAAPGRTVRLRATKWRIR
jgi:hypothetical protein